MKKYFVSICISMFSLLAIMLPGARYYVSTGGSTSSDGLSWPQAKQTITQAVTAAVEGDEIWVAVGTYVESDTVTVPANVSLYGGFSGTEAVLSERVIKNNATIIDGVDSHQCVYNYGIVDGFHLINGIASQAGGIYNNSGTISNCRIYANHGIGQGGGIYNKSGLISNCIIYNNTCMIYGAGIYDNEGTIIHCTLYCNQGNRGPGSGIYTWKGSIINCISWNNSIGDIAHREGSIKNCCYGEASDSNGCFSGNPLFVNTSGDSSLWDFHLQNESPCIDMGSLADTTAEDIDGTLRPGGDDKVCIGAYESIDSYVPGAPDQSLVKRFYVSSAGDNTTGVSWQTAYNSPMDAISQTLNYDGYCEIYVAAGIYSGTLYIPSKVSIYGGFSGAEATISERNPAVNISIIDGNGGYGIMNSGLVDGFHVRNCFAMETSGSGIHNYCGSVSNCSLYNNQNSCAFYNNQGTAYNCIVFNNSGMSSCVGIRNVYGGIIVNCTVYGNTALMDPCGIFNSNDSVVINCIAWGHSGTDISCNVDAPGTISYSCYETGVNVAGSNNIQLDPLFVNTDQYNFFLQSGSPCIDSATDSGAPAIDISGFARPWGNGYDMGAYEYHEIDTEVCNTVFSLYK